MAAALFVCLALGAGLKGDETALVPVALERGGSRQRSSRHVGGSTLVDDDEKLPVEERRGGGGDTYTFKELIGQKALWKYLGKPKRTVDIGDPPLPREFHLRLMKKVPRSQQEMVDLELDVQFTPNDGHRERQEGECVFISIRNTATRPTRDSRCRP